MTREVYLDIQSTRYASIIYATCVMHTSNGNWSVDLSEIAEGNVLRDTELHQAIEDKLLGYEGVLDVERDGTDYDLILGTCYFDYNYYESEQLLEDIQAYIRYMCLNDQINSVLNAYGLTTENWEYITIPQEKRLDYVNNVVLEDYRFIDACIGEDSFMKDFDEWREKYE